MSRPFFSLVVPCYNDGRYKTGTYLDRLLQSVVDSNLNYEDIEVILSDDLSPKSYGRIISKYEPFFKIKQISTHEHLGPGNTRQVGTAIAEGEWLCFADHDDAFYPRALHTVKDLIEHEKKSALFAFADFDKVAENDDKKIVEEFRGSTNNSLCFVHGKFYNLDLLWNKYNIHFLRELKTHEDLALKVQVECVLKKYQDNDIVLHIPTPVYKWTDNKSSISNTEYVDENGHTFFERAYKDFLRANCVSYIDQYNLGRLDKSELANIMIPMLSSCWFQISNFKINDPEGYYKENEQYLNSVWRQFLDITQLKTTVVLMIIQQSFPDLYFKINRTAQFYKLPSFEQWMDQINQEGQQ